MDSDGTIQKKEIRRRGRLARRELESRETRSRQIAQRIASLQAYQDANAVCCYVHSQFEVQTLDIIRDRLRNNQATFVPYCDGDQLRLFPLEEIEQLEIGRFGILEPLASLRSEATPVDVNNIAVYLVPGVAFDQKCHRIGQGAGFYDRLLVQLSGKTIIGLAFDCQVFPEITAQQHDIPMDFVVTESRIIWQS